MAIGSSGTLVLTQATSRSRLHLVRRSLAKMRDEVRYRLEFCACGADRYQDLPIELLETP